MTELSQFVGEKGFQIDFPCNGEFFRFDRGGTLNGWFVGRQYQVGDRLITVARFGDWRTGEKYKWQTEGEFSPEELKSISRHIEESEQKEKEDRLRLQQEVAELSEARWRLAKDQGKNPYLAKKSLQTDVVWDLFSCRIDGDNLLVPCRDIDGKLWGLQRIQPDGGKYFTSGQKIKGCFHVIGEMRDGEDILIAEGIATAASIFLATGKPSVAAFNAGNLRAVAEGLRSRYPQSPIHLCGDDDRWTTRPDGRPWNPGREAALAAATASGGRALFPVFGNTDAHLTDWNDLHCLEGLSLVKSQIEGVLPGFPITDEPRTWVVDANGSGAGRGEFSRFDAWIEDLEPLEWKMGGKSKDQPIQPKHQQVVDHLLEWYGDHLMCQERDLFRYTGTHWKHLGTAETNEVIRQLQYCIGGGATHSQLLVMFNLLLACCPHTPYDIFTPRYTAANFLNGTLHLVRGSDYKFVKKFQEHRSGDFLLNVIPLNYEPEKAEKNEEFLKMLERVFEGDADSAQKIRAVRQMYGAMICPISPHLFLLHGPAGSGKSSLIIPAMRLVHQDNLCSVQPHEFKGFNMESMVGKVVNFRTDIKITEPIDDDTVKMIEDRVIIRMDRKFKTPVHAPLPPIHIFGANGVPPTKDGSSGAHDRRWTFICLDKHKTVMGAYMHDFGNWVFEQSPGGVLNFALEGLDDLIANGGHFLTPDSGKERMAEWRLESDPVGQFLADARKGEVDQNTKILFDEALRIRTVLLWENFRKWVESSGGKFGWITRFKFYAAMRDKGYRTVTVNGCAHFAGIGVTAGGESKQ